MTNPKAAPAARVSAANALLDRGYGRPAQHVTGEVAASYVARLPDVAPSAQAWLDTVKPMLTSIPVSQPLAHDDIETDTATI